MSSYPHAQRPGAPLRPRRALVILGALGLGHCLGRVLDVLDYTAPFCFGLASVAASCGLTGPMGWLKPETEADPIG